MEEKLKRRKNREIVLARRLRKRPNIHSISQTFTSSTNSSTSDETYEFDNTTDYTRPNTDNPIHETVTSKRLNSILSSSPGAFSYTPCTHDTRPQGTS